jgi:hypothetical protein
VTAELAVALPALLLVVVAAVGAVSAVTAQLRCTDAAVRAARAVARGEPAEPALRAAPEGARLAIASAGDEVRATVTVRWSLGSGLAGIDLAASAVAELEPGERAL